MANVFFFFYKITRMKVKSSECPKSIRNYEKKYLERQTLGQTFWAEMFWGIWGIFSTNSLSKFSFLQPLFLQKKNSLYI